MEPLHFTLVCYSFGGIPANVTWTKDSTVIGSGVTALREDFTGYRHTLSVTDQGFYTCTVSNASPESASASINATSKYFNLLKIHLIIPTPLILQYLILHRM